MAQYKTYQSSIYSDLANQAIKAAWLKLTEDERRELQVHIDRIIAAQDAVNQDKVHRSPTIASNGAELLAKLGWVLNGLDYCRYIEDARK